MDCKKIPKTVAALHDLSSFGRCALTVICPTLSVMGAQVCPVPTALLSTHTGGFEGFCFEDTSSFMSDALEHFKSLNISFDAVYSGFLGSVEQIKTVEAYLDTYSTAVKLVDPVLGDDGRLYSTITAEQVSEMHKLCDKADIITPNLTEAAFLLGEKIPNEINVELVFSWIDMLSQGNRSVVITGIPLNGISNAGFDCKTKEKFILSSNIERHSYPGTGDIFASVLLGGILKGNSLKEAAKKAADFTVLCIKSTNCLPTDRRNGVSLEFCLKELVQ